MGQPTAGAAGAGWGCWTWTGDSLCSAMMLPKRPGTRRPYSNFPSSNTFRPRSLPAQPAARRREEAGQRGGGGRGGRHRRPGRSPRAAEGRARERGGWARRPLAGVSAGGARLRLREQRAVCGRGGKRPRRPGSRSRWRHAGHLLTRSSRRSRRGSPRLEALPAPAAGGGLSVCRPRACRQHPRSPARLSTGPGQVWEEPHHTAGCWKAPVRPVTSTQASLERSSRVFK